MIEAAAEASAHLTVASQQLRTIVTDILRHKPAPAMVPLGVLIAPLAKRFAQDLAEFTASNTSCVVIERMSAVRRLPVAEGERLTVEAYLTKGTERAEAGLRLLAHGADAFHCQLHQLELAPERLSAPKGATHRQPEEAAIRMKVEPDQHLAYAEASGDFNPLHMDRTRCARLGLPERIVHGTLLATIAETIAQAGETGTMAMRFASPCFVGEAMSAAAIERPQGGRRVVIYGADSRLVCAMDWKP